MASADDFPRREISEKVIQLSCSLTAHARVHQLPKRLENDYEVEGTVLGTGMSGGVKRATSKHLASQQVQMQRFAVKTLSIEHLKPHEWNALLQEVSVGLMMDHPNVASLYDVYVTKQEAHLVMECMEGGELISHRHSSFSEHGARRASWQMIMAVNYMHSKGVVHRDLKPQNFLFAEKHSRHMKLVDFGLTKFHQGRRTGRSNSEPMNEICGSLPYIAPEVWSGEYTSSCDLWSLGVIVFRLLLGRLPFSLSSTSPGDWAQVISTGKYTIDGNCALALSRQSLDFVKRLLVVQTEKRMTLPEAIAHPWFATFHKAEKTVSIELVDDLLHFASMPAFQRACYHIMVLSLPVDVRKELRPVFLTMDADHDGAVQVAELKHLIREDWDMSDKDLSLTFQALDHDGSGEIMWSEFLAAVAPRFVNGDQEMLLTVFRRFDEDGSGTIKIGELRDVLGMDLPVDEIMHTMDLNHDAEISKDEWLSFFAHEESERGASSRVELRRPAAIKKDRKDTDDSGPWAWLQCCSLRQDKRGSS